MMRIDVSGMLQGLLQKVGIRRLVVLGLLMAAINCLNAGLGTIIRGATISVFIPLGVGGALLGWWLASGRFKAWQAWAGILLLGTALLWSSTAQLGTPLLQLAESLAADAYRQTLSLPETEPPVPDPDPGPSPVTIAIESLAAQSSALWQRVLLWVQGTLAGSRIDDPVVRVLAWSLMLWPMAAWTGWALRRGQTLAGMAPALALLALVVDYTGTDVWPLWGLFCITLLLMGLMYYETSLQRWARHGMDYAEIIQGDTTMAVLVVTIVLALAALLVPLVPVEEIADALREGVQPQVTNQRLAETLGLQPAPRPAEPKPGAGGRTGLQGGHMLGAGPRLSNNPIMSIRTGELAPVASAAQVVTVPNHHWRNTAFDIYTGSGWLNSRFETRRYAPGTALFEQVPEGYRVLEQHITMLGGGAGEPYWAGTLYRADQPLAVGWRTPPEDAGSADMSGASATAKSYKIESLLPAVSIAQLRAAPLVYPEDIRRRYLTLPADVPERVLALARQLTATAATPYDRAQAIEAYLRRTYPYTLEVGRPPAGRDVADYFLFELKTGFCDHYATAMVVLARAAGLPARFVIGYASGTYDRFTAEYIVLQSDAHAWAEVYFPGIGWVDFEPTAGRALMEHSPRSDLPPAGPIGPQNLLTGFDPLTTLSDALPPMASWSLAALLGLAVLALLLQAGEAWLLARFPTTRALRWIYGGIYRLGRKLTGPAAEGPGETAYEFARTLHGKLETLAKHSRFKSLFTPAAAELQLLTALYLDALYGPHPPAPDELRPALRAWQSLRWRLWLAGLGRK